MKKYFVTCFCLLALGACAVLISACSDDEESRPSISLSETAVTASAGDDVVVDLDISAAAGFKKLVVTKKWDGVDQDEETFDTAPSSYTYTVIEEDADHVVTLNFTVTDKDNRTAQRELVITIELTARQILLKYNWRLSDEIRKKTNQSDIQDVYNDDVYRFNADGTYNMSNGAKNDAFGNEVNKYCYYNLNDNTLRLLMSMTTYDGGLNKYTRVDTLDITVIDETKFYANINYYGLDQLGVPGYDPVEQYEKRLVAVAKTANFDPYKVGPDDDTTGPIPTDTCEEVEFEND